MAEEIFAYFMGSCRDGVPCFIVEDGLESLQEEVKILCVEGSSSDFRTFNGITI